MSNAIASISPKVLSESIVRGDAPVMIDVRTPAEYAEVHAPGARLLPLDTISPEKLANDLAGEPGRPVYVFCRSGARARMACERLRGSNIPVCIVEGGVQAWADAGLPVIRGKGVISLERQVRIAAGSLVLLGVSLGFGLHPVFFGLSAFVGGGLVFAGVTDTCGMAMLLARMPWNQVSGGGASCAAKS